MISKTPGGDTPPPLSFPDSAFGEGNPERIRIRTGSDGIRNRCRILSESEFRIRSESEFRIRSESGPNPVRIRIPYPQYRFYLKNWSKKGAERVPVCAILI